jgi:hypothetical protein
MVPLDDILTHLAEIFSDPVSLGFGAACVALLSLCYATSRQRSDTVMLAWALIAAWGFSKIVAGALGWTFARSLYPFTDCIGGLLAVWSFTERPARWKVALALVFLTKAGLDVIFVSLTGSYPYLLALNILFGMEIICVAFPGGTALARRAREHLFRRLGRSRLDEVAARRDPRAK